MNESAQPQPPQATLLARRIAVGVVIIVWAQALVLTAIALLDLSETGTDRLAVGLGGSVILAAYGVALATAGWFFLQWREWTRGLILVTQLVQLGLAWNTRGSDPGWLAPVLAIIAVTVLAGVFSRPVTRAFHADSDI